MCIQSAVYPLNLLITKYTVCCFLSGNHGSAFMEIKVSRSDRDFINLLPSVTLMSPADSKLGFRKTGRRKFGTCKLMTQINGLQFISV